jgi:hypothetical protein
MGWVRPRPQTPFVAGSGEDDEGEEEGEVFARFAMVRVVDSAAAVSGSVGGGDLVSPLPEDARSWSFGSERTSVSGASTRPETPKDERRGRYQRLLSILKSDRGPRFLRDNAMRDELYALYEAAMASLPFAHDDDAFDLILELIGVLHAALKSSIMEDERLCEVADANLNSCSRAEYADGFCESLRSASSVNLGGDDDCAAGYIPVERAADLARSGFSSLRARPPASFSFDTFRDNSPTRSSPEIRVEEWSVSSFDSSRDETGQICYPAETIENDSPLRHVETPRERSVTPDPTPIQLTYTDPGDSEDSLSTTFVFQVQLRECSYSAAAAFSER